MKKVLLILICTIFSISIYAQTPQGVSHQATIRNNENELIKNSPIGLRISILRGSETGTPVYVETQHPTSNSNGLITYVIGSGNVVSGTFAAIDWTSGNYYLKTEADPLGGTSYVISGATQFLSVPFAFHAQTAESFTETDPVYSAWDKDYNDLSNKPTTITTAQANEITANTAKNSYPAADATKLAGIAEDADVNVQADWNASSGDALILNKPTLFTNSDETDPVFSISPAVNITVSDATNLGNLSGTNTGDQDISGIATNTAAIALNTAKTGITEAQADAIVANTAKVGVTPGTAAGQMQYWNGSAWVTVAATENEGATLQMIGGIPTWVGGTAPATVPDAPTIGTATAGDTQASVPFTAPASDGGSTITEYTATSSPGSITGTLTQAGSGTITVSGLTNGTAYTFTVTATNAVGTGAASAASNSVTPALPLSIGDSYQGGKIAYILQSGDPGYDENVQHGLIAAASDQSTDAEWGCYQTEISGADGTALGTGNQNTIDIEVGCTTPGIAAEICANLTSNGYDDWYLPSKDELNKLYLNRNAIGGFATAVSTASNYWTSTELSISSAWFQSFYNGLQGETGGKFNSLRVRAVRAF